MREKKTTNGKNHPAFQFVCFHVTCSFEVTQRKIISSKTLFTSQLFCPMCESTHAVRSLLCTDLCLFFCGMLAPFISCSCSCSRPCSISFYVYCFHSLFSTVVKQAHLKWRNKKTQLKLTFSLHFQMIIA